MAVYFQDVANDFVSHYFSLFNTDRPRIAPMYAQNTELKINDQCFRGPEAAVDAISKLNLEFPPQKGSFLAHPGKNPGDVIITCNASHESDSFVITFVLASVGENNQFGITHQLVHKVPK